MQVVRKYVTAETLTKLFSEQDKRGSPSEGLTFNHGGKKA